MSKEFKLKVTAKLREPVTKTREGIDCKMNVVFDRTCSPNDYLFFCCSLVNSLVEEAHEEEQSKLKEALALVCLMPEDFFMNRKERVAVDVNQLNKERSHEE